MIQKMHLIELFMTCVTIAKQSKRHIVAQADHVSNRVPRSTLDRQGTDISIGYRPRVDR